VRGVAYWLRRDAIPAVARADSGVIYCVGDSFTYGQGVEPDEAWPQVLGRLLRGAMPDHPPPIRTLAEPGRSSSTSVLDVKTALGAGDARLVLILTG